MTPIEKLLDERVTWEEHEPPANPGTLPYVVKSGTLDLEGFPLRAYVLSTGQRIFDSEDIHKLFEEFFEVKP